MPAWGACLFWDAFVDEWNDTDLACAPLAAITVGRLLGVAVGLGLGSSMGLLGPFE